MSSIFSRTAQLNVRHLYGEVMDLPGLPESELTPALKSLRRINSLSFVAHTLWSEIVRWQKRTGVTELSVLDLGCGLGDILGSLARRAATHFNGSAIKFSALGLDNNPHTVAQARAENYRNCHFQTWNAATDLLPTGYTIVISTLFFHHLEEKCLQRILQQVRDSSAKFLLVSDLRRSAPAFYFTKVATHILSRSPIVHTDGPRSVQAAFTVSELRELAENSLGGPVSLTREFPFRLLLGWERQN